MQLIVADRHDKLKAAKPSEWVLFFIHNINWSANIHIIHILKNQHRTPHPPWCVTDEGS